MEIQGATMADLVDMRLKVTEETNQVLEAKTRVSGLDKSEIARRALHDWAMACKHEATLICRLSRGEGGGAA